MYFFMSWATIYGPYKTDSMNVVSRNTVTNMPELMIGRNIKNVTMRIYSCIIIYKYLHNCSVR
jgi:hypothetical protein